MGTEARLSTGVQTCEFSTHNSDIIQLSAKHLDTGDTFSTYIRPAGGYIPPKITSITEITIRGEQMFYNMTPVESTDTLTGLSSFSEWLKKFNNPVLIAHNAAFDTRIILNSFLHCSVSHSHIHGFADSLKLCKEVFPGHSSYKLSAIIKDILKQDFNAHNANDDVAALADLLQTVDDLPKKLQITLLQEAHNKLNKLKNEIEFLPTYDRYVNEKVLAKTTAKELAGTGLDGRLLQETYRCSGRDGLSELLRNRLVKSAKPITNLSSYFESIYNSACSTASHVQNV
ncbi:DNA polymerase III PolC-type-like [Mya arenaria]|uniref:DNA polymerase III PolC-type-like n=1 Tax=Mya arenaria TaxID=6604 RepID=UPI0022DEDDC0|nr:DNA polymerase III PolC-type-like [Mya arenaria]